MLERSEIPARNCRHWLRVLVCIALTLSILLPAGIPNTAKNAPGGTEQLPAALRQLGQVDILSVPEELKALKRAVDLYLNERYAAALDALPDERAITTTSIADYFLFYRAKANLMLARNREALDYFRLLESRFPDSSLIRDALLGQCQALLKLEDPKPVLSILKNSRINQDSESLYYEARALELTGEKDQAIERYLSLYSGYPQSNSSASVERNLLALSPGALKGGRNYEARLIRSENLLQAKSARAARSLLQALGQVKAPDSMSSQKRILLLAEAEYNLGRTSTALVLLRKIAASDPALHSRAVRLEGSCYRKLKREQALLSQRDKALKLYPGSSETEELCYSVATYFDVSYKSAKSREAYRVLFENFPKGKYAERTLWKVALFHYSEKEYREAAVGFWRYLLAYPKPLSAGSAMYWMGRCYELLGGSKNAAYLYGRAQALANNSYYGQCARKAETSLGKFADTDIISIPGIDFERVIAACDAIRLPVIRLQEPSTAALPAIERARQLWAAGLSDPALSELRRTIRRSPQDEKPLSYIIARIHGSEADHYKAFVSLRGIHPDLAGLPSAMLPEEIWQLLFPVRHWDIISTQAAKSDLSPTLILGIIRQESAFNEKARSSANARGLMQLLPSTAIRVVRQARIKRYTVQKLYQPETNIILGTQCLAFLLRRYGKPELALAAYNAGGSRVDRWLKEFSNADMPEFVEQIPFSETRGYVKQVLSNQAIYGLLTSSAAAANPGINYDKTYALTEGRTIH